MATDTLSGWGAILLAAAAVLVLSDLGVTGWKVGLAAALILFGVVCVKAGD
jgi:hypothetical protein